MCDLTFINPVTGTRSKNKSANVVADADGNAVLGPWDIHTNAAAGETTLELTSTKTDGTNIIVTHPYILRKDRNASVRVSWRGTAKLKFRLKDYAPKKYEIGGSRLWE